LSIGFIPFDVHLRVAELGNDSAQELVFLPGVGKKMTAVKVVVPGDSQK
jgi:endonuclease III